MTARTALVDQPEAAALTSAALAAFGLGAGDAEPLGGERDTNLLVRLSDGSRAVLKLVTEQAAASSIALQAAALQYMALTAPALPMPRVLPVPGGALMAPLPGRAVAWMLSYLPGHLLSATTPGAFTLRGLGTTCGELTNGLRGFDHPGLDRPLIWSVAGAADALGLTVWIEDAHARRLAEPVLQRAASSLPAFRALPQQALHGDLNPWNVLVADDGRIAGLIDLGDMHRGPRAAELAVALSYHLAQGEAAIAAMLEGYRTRIALDGAEQDALPLLVASRLAMTVAIASWRARQMPEASAYLLRNVPAAVRGLEWLQTQDLRGTVTQAQAGSQPA